MDKKPVDVAGEVAEVARVALDAVLLRPERRKEFVEEFVRAAGDGMACAARQEDVERFVFLSVDRLLADSEFCDTLVMLINVGLKEYMRPV